jgi:hypothetical protein
MQQDPPANTLLYVLMCESNIGQYKSCGDR